MKSIAALSLFLFASFLTTACGVRIESSTSQQELIRDDFVTFSFYEVDARGDLRFLVSDCINLDDLSDEGSVYIETPYIGEDLTMHWGRSLEMLHLDFEADYASIFTTDFRTHYFRTGNTAEFTVGTGYSDYLIELSGPLCLAP